MDKNNIRKYQGFDGNLDHRFSMIVAQTSDEKEEIYRLRYQVYIEEMHLTFYNVDYQRKIITDSMDDNAILIYAVDLLKNKVIGAVRINFHQDISSDFKHYYSMQDFYPYYPNYVAQTSRAVIHPEYRRKKVTIELFKYLYNIKLQLGIVYDFISCRESLVKFYEKLGYRVYKHRCTHPEGISERMPMLLCTIDKNYFQQINSPFLPIIEQSTSKLVCKFPKTHTLYDHKPIQILQNLISRNKLIKSTQIYNYTFSA